MTRVGLRGRRPGQVWRERVVARRRRCHLHHLLAPVGLVLTVALLNGCTTLSEPAQTVAPSVAAELARTHAAQLEALVNWRLSGRIAVQRDDQGFSADLEWQQHADSFDLTVTGPLSSGSFALRGDAGEVTLTKPDGNSFTAASAEALMSNHLGWVLPVSGARYWVRGMPAPAPPAGQERRDARGRWTDFAQSGWRVSVLDYLERQQVDLPRKLFMNRDTLKVRMVIKQWHAQ